MRAPKISGEVARIPLTQGYEALVDIDDVALVAGHKWYARVARRKDGSVRTVYAQRGDYSTGKRVAIQMHHVILGVAPGFEVDHRSGDGLDNRRENLRLADRAQNNHNRRLATTNKTGVKGVSLLPSGRYQAQIACRGELHYLGSFDTLEDAAAARNAAAARLHGEFARST